MGLSGVTFDNINTLSMWDFFLVTKTITPPQPKLYKIDVPGGNGSLDLTESLFGSIAYDDRSITMKFRCIGDWRMWDIKRTDILAALHGRRMKIIFEDEPTYFYEGRVIVTSFRYNKDVAEMEVQADCDPFKYELSSEGSDWLWDTFDFELGVITDDYTTVSGTTKVTITVKKKPICPRFKADSVITLKYGGLEKTIPANKEITFYDIYMTEGSHTLTFEGNGKVKIMYNNGVL